MLDTLPVHIISWYAWTPRLSSREAWIEWIKQHPAPTEELFGGESVPATDFLPLSMRKKLSPVTKVSLYVAHHCLDPNSRKSTPTIFASRHGESSVTVELLESIARNEPVGPMSFSRSVHNTASGLFGMAEQNVAPSTAVSASENTFRMGLLEAALQLHEEGLGAKRLFIYADERIPAPFQPYVHDVPATYGVAFLLETNEGSFDTFQRDPNDPLTLLWEVVKREAA